MPLQISTLKINAFPMQAPFDILDTSSVLSYTIDSYYARRAHNLPFDTNIITTVYSYTINSQKCICNLMLFYIPDGHAPSCLANSCNWCWCRCCAICRSWHVWQDREASPWLAANSVKRHHNINIYIIQMIRECVCVWKSKVCMLYSYMHIVMFRVV